MTLSVRLCAVLVCFLSMIPATAWSLPVGATAPDIELQTARGTPFSLQQYVGQKPVLLIFWTTWCPYCKQAFKEMDAFLADYDPESLAVIGINSGWRDTVSRMQRFQEQYQLDIPLAFDTDHRVSQKYAIQGVPTIILVDQNKEVVYSGHRLTRSLSAILKGIIHTDAEQ
ncbi:MAG: TlpA family protein disulfide reductase [Desulfohalobiaceae bacterium]|nr:TlpA family protein disulfide reductase [Desulfohalobiaceae bacterium]